MKIIVIYILHLEVFLRRCRLFPSIYKNFRTIIQNGTKKSNIVRFPESLKCIKLEKNPSRYYFKHKKFK